MSQMESAFRPANDANIDPKTSATVTVIDVSDPKSTKTISQQQQSNNVWKERLDKAMIRFSSRMVLFQIAAMLATSIVQLYYGIQNQHKCPIQPLIDTFLIVHGAVGIAGVANLIAAYIIANYIKRSADPLPCARYLLAVNMIVQLVLVVFNVAWLIAGQVWVFGAMTNGFQDDNPHQLPTFCYAKVFWPAFVIIFITYLIWIIMILVFISKPIKKCIKKRHQIKHETNL